MASAFFVKSFLEKIFNIDNKITIITCENPAGVLL